MSHLTPAIRRLHRGQRGICTMKVRTLALLGLVEWTSGCTAQANSIHDDTKANTGGSQSASGGQEGLGGASTGGNANVGGTSFLDEGEKLLGACMSPSGNPCRDYLAYPVLDGEYTTEAAYEHCYNLYTDAFSESLWREGEHCPLEGVALVCKSSVEITYSYTDNTLTADEAEEGCQTGDGYGVPVYWRSEDADR